MNLFLDTAPIELPVSLDEAKAHLRITHSAEDTHLALLIGAAVEHAEESGLQIVTATWKQTLEAWPTGGKPIKLYRHPVQAITSIQYVDENGDTQTLDAASYQLSAPDRQRARVNLVHGESWPSLYPDRMDAVTITFTAGFGAQADCPSGLKVALLAILTELYDRRGDVAPGAPLHRVPMGIERCLRSFRIREV